MSDQQMDMVSHGSGFQECAIVMGNDATYVGVQFDADGVVQHGLAILG